ncbi:hypothetical protein SERLA73DRAFT_149013 [Serpula lacrymans var. lacrymans S7.3]|uniref:Uncharacterized protein n=1 Tax=Serpula lacrymans var. lacrymans (strain S7.3) TaxID=936435 RepID=F8PHR9_SERL3|nr:hypothetical protein SERLA73DRAFT_149013 [Serpula lacrymans var. lacrymans S7.3]
MAMYWREQHTNFHHNQITKRKRRRKATDKDKQCCIFAILQFSAANLPRTRLTTVSTVIFPNPLSTSGIGPVTLGGGNEDHSPVEHTPIYSTSKMLPMATAAVPLHTTINVQDIEMCNTWAVHVSQVDQRPPIPRHHSLTTVRQRSNQSMPYLPHAKSQGHIQQGIGEAVFNCLQSASFSVQPENQKLNQAGMGHQSAPLSLLEVSQLQYQKQQPSVVNSFGASRSRMTDKNVPDIWILQTEDKKSGTGMGLLFTTRCSCRKPPANMKATFITFNYAKPVYNSLGEDSNNGGKLHNV